MNRGIGQAFVEALPQRGAGKVYVSVRDTSTLSSQTFETYRYSLDFCRTTTHQGQHAASHIATIGRRQECHLDQCIHRHAAKAAGVGRTTCQGDRGIGTPCPRILVGTASSKPGWKEGHHVRPMAQRRGLPSDAQGSCATAVSQASTGDRRVRARHVRSCAIFFPSGRRCIVSFPWRFDDRQRSGVGTSSMTARADLPENLDTFQADAGHTIAQT